MNACVKCQHCKMIAFNHPYFGVVEKIVCDNVVDDEIAEVPGDMLFAEQEIPCFGFRHKDSAPKKKSNEPIIFGVE